MKIVVKKIDALRREMRFEIPKDRVSAAMDEVYKDIGKVTKVKGFRPGKTPRHILENEHGALAKEEAIKKIIPEAYKEGLEQEELSPLDLPEILDVDFKDGIIKFTAKFDVKPEIKIKNYKGIKVKRKSSKVTEQEIDKTLDYFKKSQGPEKEVSIDDEFAKGLGFPNLEEFKKSLSAQMEIDKNRQNRFDVENQIVEAILKEAKLSVPQNFVKKQIEHRIAEAVKRMKAQGLPEEDIQKKEKELQKELKIPVEKDVKTYLIFDKIAELEGIHVPQGESLPNKVMELLLKEADWQENEEKPA